MFQYRTLGRDESLLRHPGDQSSDLIAHPGEWYRLAPQYADESWHITSLNLILAGPGLLSQLRGFGGAGGILEFGFATHDGYNRVRDTANLALNAVETATDWNAGTHAGTLVDLAARTGESGEAQPGLRGDLRNAPAPAVWTSPSMPLRYGASISGLTWQADLVRDEAGVPIASSRIILECGITDAAGVTTWTAALTVQTAAQFEAGSLDLAAPSACDRYRISIELDYVQVGQAAHRESAPLRTAVFFMVGVWIVLASPEWRIRSLADLILRSEPDRELRAKDFDGSWDVCAARLPLGLAITGRLREGISARLTQPGAGLRFLEIHALTDVSFEEP